MQVSGQIFYGSVVQLLDIKALGVAEWIVKQIESGSHPACVMLDDVYVQFSVGYGVRPDHWFDVLDPYGTSIFAWHFDPDAPRKTFAELVDCLSRKEFTPELWTHVFVAYSSTERSYRHESL